MPSGELAHLRSRRPDLTRSNAAWREAISPGEPEETVRGETLRLHKSAASLWVFGPLIWNPHYLAKFIFFNSTAKRRF